MIYNKWFYVCCQHFFFVLKICWKTILKKTGIILLSTLLFALCSGLLYITKMAGSIHITRPEDEPELASAMTNENLDMKVEDFVSFNWNSAADAINLLGGVDIELSRAEFYYINAFITETVDTTGIPSTHLDGPGMQHLDGVQAVAYMRLRQMDTDFKRTERQRSVTQQVFDKARKADIATLIQVFHTVAPQIMTSISEEEFMEIAYNIKSYHISGTA